MLPFPLLLLSVHAFCAGLRTHAPVPSTIPTLGPAVGRALRGFLARPAAEGLAGLRDTVYESPRADQPEKTADSALYHLLTNEKTLRKHEARLAQAMDPADMVKLKEAAAALRVLASADAKVKALMSVQRLPDWALDRLYDAASEPGRLLAGAGVSQADGAYHALDDKTINDLELAQPQTGLFAQIDRAATALGRARLDYMLRHPSMDLGEVRARQSAVSVLLEKGPIRAQTDSALQGLASRIDSSLLERLAAGGSWRGAFVMANGVSVVLLVITGLFLFGLPLSGQPLQLLGIASQVAFLWFMLGHRPAAELQEARGEFGRYKAAFAAARSLSGPLLASESSALRGLGRRLIVDGPAADPGVADAAKRLARLSESPLMKVMDYVLFHGAKSMWRLDSVMKQAKPKVLDLLGALAELDAYRALALYGEAHAAKGRPFTLPEALDGKPRLSITNGHNPYLALNGERSVPNDVELGAGGERRNFAVLTGSNMGGKSTYLKMGAQLQLLAQIGSAVPAEAMAFTVLKIMSSIDIRDNIVEGKSLYDAETDRALALLRAAEAAGHFLIMDEILQGTNPEESTAAQWALVRYMAKTDNLFTLATHNPNVTKLEGVEPGVFNLHVEERVEPNGEMTFPHRILPGPAVSRNGLRTLKVKGFPQEVVAEAELVVAREQDPAKPKR